MKNSRPSGFSRLGVILILAFPAWSGVSQSIGSISGKVIDVKTNAPVPFATVFLANTMIGVIAKEDGSYSLQKIPNGKYDLTVSCVGYKLLALPISFSGNKEKKDLLLSEAVEILKEVVIKTRHVSPGDLRKFKAYFLGETINASKCTITNIDEIDFDYDEDTQVLTAAASLPIEVENKALGFRVFYLLKKFELDLKNNIVKVAGIPRFEALPPRNESQQRHWIKERDRAYLGSLNHFMRSLKAQSLTKNYFEDLLGGKTNERKDGSESKARAFLRRGIGFLYHQ